MQFSCSYFGKIYIDCDMKEYVSSQLAWPDECKIRYFVFRLCTVYEVESLFEWINLIALDRAKETPYALQMLSAHSINSTQGTSFTRDFFSKY